MSIDFFLLGMGGALSVEILKLYELMGKLDADKFKALLCSRLYWLIIFLMSLASGFIAWGINIDAGTASTWQIIISGIGARSLINKPIELNVAHNNSDLGETDTTKITLKDIFG